MTPASRIPIEPGDKVLDLCAAPGGKATAAGAALQGQGLLVANDISTSRARALLRNLELFGIPNIFVANETPAKLTKTFPEFFDKIILDAPCSGEGMFRKEEALAKDWTPEKSSNLADIQRTLILQAADMLRPGGMLLYSTCTFAPEEDEKTVSFLLEQHPEMEIKVANAEGLRECRKLMTMAKAGKYNGYLLEGMACPGGCIAGAGTMLSLDQAAKAVEFAKKASTKKNPLESEFSGLAEELT